MGRLEGRGRTSSDFSAVAAASERAVLLCTSSLMASPVQPWLGSVLYHTAARVPLPFCFPSPSPSLFPFSLLLADRETPSPLRPSTPPPSSSFSLHLAPLNPLLLPASLQAHTALATRPVAYEYFLFRGILPESILFASFRRRTTPR